MLSMTDPKTDPCGTPFITADEELKESVEILPNVNDFLEFRFKISGSCSLTSFKLNRDSNNLFNDYNNSGMILIFLYSSIN